MVSLGSSDPADGAPVNELIEGSEADGAPLREPGGTHQKAVRDKNIVVEAVSVTGRILEERHSRKGTAAAAVAVCAFMFCMLGSPPVAADTHHLERGVQGPRGSAVSWEYAPAEYGIWSGYIINSGLKFLVIDVEDVTTGWPTLVMHQEIRLVAYPADTVKTNHCVMSKDRAYLITATPNGPHGSSCTIDDEFTNHPPIVALFNYSVEGMTIHVDGSASTNGIGTIVAYGWEWGDDTIGTGVTASHTYAATGVYTVILTVLDDEGFTGSTCHDVEIQPDIPPDESSGDTSQGSNHPISPRN